MTNPSAVPVIDIGPLVGPGGGSKEEVAQPNRPRLSRHRIFLYFQSRNGPGIGIPPSNPEPRIFQKARRGKNENLDESGRTGLARIFSRRKRADLG